MADVYKVGVSLVLQNGVSAVLAVITKDLLGLRAPISQIESSFSAWSPKIIAATAALGGAGLLGALVAVVGKAAEFEDKMISLQRMGGTMESAVRSGAIKSKAFEIAQSVPLKVETIAGIMGTSYSILRGNMDEVYTAAPELAKLGYVLKHDKDYHGSGDVNKEVTDALRAGELTGRVTDDKGQIDVKKLHDWLDLVSRISTATHGIVNGTTLLGMAQQGGFTMRNLTPEGMAQLAVLAQAMGGHRAGTAYMSLWQQMAGGTMFKRTAEGMQELGLLSPGEWSTSGGRVILGNDASKRLTALVGKDPMAFAQEVKKRMEAQGITDPLDQQRAIMRMLNRQTTQRFEGEMNSNLNQQLAERGLIDQAYSVGQSLDLEQAKSITTAFDNLSTAWHNLSVAVGDPGSANMVSDINSIASAMKSLTGVVNAHPEMTKAALEGVATLASGLFVGGAAILLSAGLLAGAPAILLGVAGALGALAALHWDQFSKWLDNDNVARWFSSLASVAWDKISSGASSLANIAWQKISEMFDGIGRAISSFLSSISGLYGKVKSIFGSVVGGISYHPSQDAVPHFQPAAWHGRFTPSINHKMQPITVVAKMDVDGQTLAQAVSDQLERMTTYATQAPTPDGSGRFFGGDHNYADT